MSKTIHVANRLFFDGCLFGNEILKTTTFNELLHSSENL